MNLWQHRKKASLVSITLALIASSPVLAQLAVIDATDPENIIISFDEDPHLYAPGFPEYPTVVYVEPTTWPPGSTGVTSGGTATNETDPYTAQAPVVVTSEPDTYSLSSASVYYTPPAEPAGPHNALTGPLKFDLGPGPVASGYTQVRSSTAYGSHGYGWGDTSRVGERDRGGSDPVARDNCYVDKSPTPFFVDVPNGTYSVSVLIGDAVNKTSASIRAEGLPQISLSAAAGKYAEGDFTLTVKDGRLMLEFFTGGLAHISAITVTPISDDAPRRTTIFVASDSTASSYSMGVYPMTGWGARMANYFDEEIAIDNLAQPGRSSKSFYEEGWLDTIKSRIKPGDYLFVMFAINDSADDNSNRKTRPDSTFKAYLRLYVDVARENGAYPVFVTSQTKRTFDAWGRFYNSVGAYPQAMRELGAELNVPVVDLNKKSIDFLTAIGPEAAKDTYMFLDPGEYPGWPNGATDYIHLQDTGAKQFAGLIAQAVRELNIQPLAQHVLTTPRPRDESESRSSY